MNGDRAPWIIGGAIVLAGFLIAVAVYLSRADVSPPVVTAQPTQALTRPPSVSPAASTPPEHAPQDDAKAQHGLRATVGAANGIVADTGTFTSAGSLELARSLPQFTYQPSVRESTGPDQISLATSPTAWAAASHSDSGMCFWIKSTIDPSEGTTVTTYGIGTPCTGNAAMSSGNLPNWPT